MGAIKGKCGVKRQHQFSAVSGNVILDHTFWCSCIFDPSKGTVKQVSSFIFLFLFLSNSSTEDWVFIVPLHCMKLTGSCLQLPANVKLSSSKSMADAKGKSHADKGDVKMKGKAIVGELPVQDKMESSCQNCLVTLDIFAGCGGLSHGLEQSGTYGVSVIHIIYNSTKQS